MSTRSNTLRLQFHRGLTQDIRFVYHDDVLSTPSHSPLALHIGEGSRSCRSEFIFPRTRHQEDVIATAPATVPAHLHTDAEEERIASMLHQATGSFGFGPIILSLLPSTSCFSQSESQPPRLGSQWRGRVKNAVLSSHLCEWAIDPLTALHTQSGWRSPTIARLRSTVTLATRLLIVLLAALFSLICLLSLLCYFTSWTSPLPARLAIFSPTEEIRSAVFDHMGHIHIGMAKMDEVAKIVKAVYWESCGNHSRHFGWVFGWRDGSKNETLLELERQGKMNYALHLCDYFARSMDIMDEGPSDWFHYEGDMDKFVEKLVIQHARFEFEDRGPDAARGGEWTHKILRAIDLWTAPDETAKTTAVNRDEKERKREGEALLTENDSDKADPDTPDTNEPDSNEDNKLNDHTNGGGSFPPHPERLFEPANHNPLLLSQWEYREENHDSYSFDALLRPRNDRLGSIFDSEFCYSFRLHRKFEYNLIDYNLADLHRKIDSYFLDSDSIQKKLHALEETKDVNRDIRDREQGRNEDTSPITMTPEAKIEFRNALLDLLHWAQKTHDHSKAMFSKFEQTCASNELLMKHGWALIVKKEEETEGAGCANASMESYAACLGFHV
ncbi:hypothetical protein HD806DRAFT_551056 [Xylariaceae sp. AK1471]|nr:hypothetical protein HD806DRAFT_551056 [Xylariaceae sp. AK1471]